MELISRFPLYPSGEYNPPPSVPHMDGKRAAPHPGRRVVFVEPPVGDAVPYDFCAGRGGGRSPRMPQKFIRTAQKSYCLFCHNVT